jgi:hypothetical protein
MKKKLKRKAVMEAISTKEKELTAVGISVTS